MDDGRGLNKSPRSSRMPGSRAWIVLLLCAASAALMLAAAVPAASPDVVFPTYYSIELLSSLLLGGLYLSSLLYSGQRWIRLALDVPGGGPWHGRAMVATGLAVCGFALLLVPVEALRIVGGPPTDLLHPGSWGPGVTSEAWASLAMSWLGVVFVALSITSRRKAWGLATWCAPLAVVLSPIWLGHSRSESPQPLMFLADSIHLVVGAWWLSGVVVFAAVLLFGPASGRRALDVAESLARFSAFARLGSLAVMLSGVGMAFLILDRFGDILGSGWGRALLIKILLVAAVVGIARWNERELRTRVERRADESDRWAALRTMMASEAVLLAAVVVLTGFVTQMSPG